MASKSLQTRELQKSRYQSFVETRTTELKAKGVADPDVSKDPKIKQFNANHHPDIMFRPNSYMQGFVTGMIFVECLKRAERAGQLNSDGLVKALKSLKGFETGGLTAPLTIKNNRFPVARIWQANVEKGIFEPAPLPAGLEHWIRIGY